MLLDQNRIFIDLPLTSKDAVLDFLAKDAVKNGRASDETIVKERFWDREKEFSTAVQEGVAIPHVKDSVVNEATLYFLKLENPIPWESPDDYQVSMVFAILVPENEGNTTHLHILSGIAVNLMDDDFKKALSDASSPAEILAILEAVKP